VLVGWEAEHRESGITGGGATTATTEQGYMGASPSSWISPSAPVGGVAAGELV